MRRWRSYPLGVWIAVLLVAVVAVLYLLLLIARILILTFTRGDRRVNWIAKHDKLLEEMWSGAGISVSLGIVFCIILIYAIILKLTAAGIIHIP